MPFEMKKMDGGWLNVYMYNVLSGLITSIEITNVFFYIHCTWREKITNVPFSLQKSCLLQRLNETYCGLRRFEYNT